MTDPPVQTSSKSLLTLSRSQQLQPRGKPHLLPGRFLASFTSNTPRMFKPAEGKDDVPEREALLSNGFQNKEKSLKCLSCLLFLWSILLCFKLKLPIKSFWCATVICLLRDKNTLASFWHRTSRKLSQNTIWPCQDIVFQTAQWRKDAALRCYVPFIILCAYYSLEKAQTKSPSSLVSTALRSPTWEQNLHIAGFCLGISCTSQPTLCSSWASNVFYSLTTAWLMPKCLGAYF